MLPNAGKQGVYGFRVRRAGCFSGGQPELRETLLRLPGRDQEQSELEAHHRRMWEHRRERAEPRERPHRVALAEERDGGRGARIGIVRGEPRGSRELALGRHAVPELPEEVAVAQLRAGVRLARRGREHAELCGAARRLR
jgi:hypothetical protein